MYSEEDSNNNIFEDEEEYHLLKFESEFSKPFGNYLNEEYNPDNQSTEATEKAFQNVFKNETLEANDFSNENNKLIYNEDNGERYFIKKSETEILVQLEEEKTENNEIVKTKDEININNTNNNINNNINNDINNNDIIHNINNNINIESEIITKDNIKTKDLLGKKRKDNFSTEKLLKRARIFALKGIIKFVNEKIKYYFNNNIGKGLLVLQFQEIDRTNLSHSNVGYDQDFLNFKLEEILSWNISGKITNFFKEHNKNLLIKLLSSENCSYYFSELFKLTFNDCLKYIQRKEFKYSELLDGLGDCEQIIEMFSKEEDLNNADYCKKFKSVFENYQIFIGSKKERQPRKKK